MRSSCSSQPRLQITGSGFRARYRRGRGSYWLTPEIDADEEDSRPVKVRIDTVKDLKSAKNHQRISQHWGTSGAKEREEHETGSNVWWKKSQSHTEHGVRNDINAEKLRECLSSLSDPRDSPANQRHVSNHMIIGGVSTILLVLEGCRKSEARLSFGFLLTLLCKLTWVTAQAGYQSCEPHSHFKVFAAPYSSPAEAGLAFLCSFSLGLQHK